MGKIHEDAKVAMNLRFEVAKYLAEGKQDSSKVAYALAAAESLKKEAVANKINNKNQ